jgi:hypothetical protein
MTIASELILRRAKDLHVGDHMTVDANGLIVSEANVAYVPMNLEESSTGEVRLTRLKGHDKKKALFSALIAKGNRLSYTPGFYPAQAGIDSVLYFTRDADGRPEYYYRVSSIRVVNKEAI